MRLHYHPLSSYSRKTAIGIALRGDVVELRELKPFAGDLKSAAFRAMNPFGKMPVLELDDGTAIYESTSILEHLEERGDRRLIPAEHAWRARHFDRLGDLYLLSPIGKFFWEKSDKQREETTATMTTAWSIWERELSDGRSFLLGDEITLGDLSAVVAAHYAETEGVPLPDAILAYKKRLEANPIVAASAAAAMPFVESTRAHRGG